MRVSCITATLDLHNVINAILFMAKIARREEKVQSGLLTL